MPRWHLCNTIMLTAKSISLNWKHCTQTFRSKTPSIHVAFAFMTGKRYGLENMWFSLVLYFYTLADKRQTQQESIQLKIFLVFCSFFCNCFSLLKWKSKWAQVRSITAKCVLYELKSITAASHLNIVRSPVYVWFKLHMHAVLLPLLLPRTIARPKW